MACKFFSFLQLRAISVQILECFQCKQLAFVLECDHSEIDVCLLSILTDPQLMSSCICLCFFSWWSCAGVVCTTAVCLFVFWGIDGLGRVQQKINHKMYLQWSLLHSKITHKMYLQWSLLHSKITHKMYMQWSLLHSKINHKLSFVSKLLSPWYNRHALLCVFKDLLTARDTDQI